MSVYYGALEAGGTKMVAGVVSEEGDILKREVFTTTTPLETMSKLIQFFKQAQPIKALGVGCFGPISLHQCAKNYGMITSTPKTSWQNFNIVSTLQEALGLPIGFDTDVNAAALAEATFKVNFENLLYLTIGTGIGGGAVVDGQLIHGKTHPEMGHMLIARHEDDPLERGICPFHENCLEGLASGPALAKRWGNTPEALPENHFAWELEAHYLALALSNIWFCFSINTMVLGGGVMHQLHLYKKIQKKLTAYINGYGVSQEFPLVHAPRLKDNSGLIGAMLLAKRSVDF